MNAATELFSGASTYSLSLLSPSQFEDWETRNGLQSIQQKTGKRQRSVDTKPEKYLKEMRVRIWERKYVWEKFHQCLSCYTAAEKYKKAAKLSVCSR